MPDRAATIGGGCVSAYEALGRCVHDRPEAECAGYLTGFCADAFTQVAVACDGETPDGGPGEDLGMVDGGPVDLGGPVDDMGEAGDMSCEPETCASMGAECGSSTNSCGGDPIDCPDTCAASESCDGNTCVADCTPTGSLTEEASMAASTGSGDKAWTGPADALVTGDGDAAATVTVRSAETAQELTLTDWGFALPADATVDGVEVVIRRAAGGSTTDDAIQLVDGGALGSPKAAGGDWPASFAEQTDGGASDTWGASLTRAQVNGSTFGVAIRPQHGGGGPSVSEVEHVTVTVHYAVSCP